MAGYSDQLAVGTRDEGGDGADIGGRHSIVLVVKNDIQQRTVDLHAAVVLYKTELAESVHEKVDA